LEQRDLLDAGMSGFVVSNLASDIPGLAAHTDKNLVNPWGFSETPQGQFRVSANGSGDSLLLNAHGNTLGKPVVIPTPSDSPQGSVAAPNGNVLNSSKTDFVISHGGTSAAATFLFSTEDGTIVGFNPKVDKTQGVIGADLSDSGAVFKLLAQGTNSKGDVLFATDFHNDKVDVFDKNFNVINSFTDPNPHAGFAPFGVKVINGTLFVTFAKQDAAGHDDVAGAGNGFIDEFTTDGTFIKRFATGTALDPVNGTSALNSPIGMAVAPPGFGPGGKFGGALLVGNFGDSHVSAFDLNTGKFLGQLSDAQGNPLVLNGGFKETNTKGLWGIGFGNGQGGTNPNSLYFAAGINLEQDGLFGKVTFSNGSHGQGQGQNGPDSDGGRDKQGSQGQSSVSSTLFSNQATLQSLAANLSGQLSKGADLGTNTTTNQTSTPTPPAQGGLDAFSPQVLHQKVIDRVFSNFS